MNWNKAAPWIVGALVLAALVALLVVPRGGTNPVATASVGAGSGNITNAQLLQLARGGALLVDVRTPVEFAGGHIEGAVNVPVDTIQQASAAWDKSKPVVVYCQTGARSLNASQYLKAQGFAHVYNLSQGVSAWDGQLVGGATAASAKGPATGRPTMYDFYTDG